MIRIYRSQILLDSAPRPRVYLLKWFHSFHEVLQLQQYNVLHKIRISQIQSPTALLSLGVSYRLQSHPPIDQNHSPLVEVIYKWEWLLLFYNHSITQIIFIENFSFFFRRINICMIHPQNKRNFFDHKQVSLSMGFVKIDVRLCNNSAATITCKTNQKCIITKSLQTYIFWVFFFSNKGPIWWDWSF